MKRLVLLFALIVTQASAAFPFGFWKTGTTPPVTTTLNSFPGLVAWYKTPISGATNGATVSTWYDSKASYNWAGSGFGPTYSTSTTLNSFPTVTATHTGYNYLSTGGPTSATFPVTMVALVKHTGTVNSGYGNFILGSGGGASGITFGLQYGTDYLTSDVFNTANIGTGNVAVTPNVWHVLVAVITSSTYAFWIDGTPAGNGSHSRTISGSPTFQFSQNDSQSTLGGSYVELGIYNTDRTADVAAITECLRTKYALAPSFVGEIAREVIGWRPTWTVNVHTLTGSAAVGTFNVLLVQGPNSLTPTATDSQGNTYTAQSSSYVTGGGRFYTLTSPVTTALSAGDTITVTYPSAVTGGSSAALWNFNNVTGVDAVNDGYYGYGTTADATLTTVASTTMMIGMVQKNFTDFSSATITAGTELVTPIPLGAQNLGVLYLNSTTAGAKTVGYTFSTDNYVWSAISLK